MIKIIESLNVKTPQENKDEKKENACVCDTILCREHLGYLEGYLDGEFDFYE